MSSQNQTSNVASAGQDDLDRMLLKFFQSEMPQNWPSAPLVDAEPAALVAERSPSRTGSGSTSRWVLAASVALLLGVCWYSLRDVGPVAPVVDQKSNLQQATAGDGPILDEMSRHKALTP